MAGFVPFRNICADMNCIAFKLILCFNSATSYTRKPLAVSVANRKTDRQNRQITEIKIVNLRLNILTIN